MPSTKRKLKTAFQEHMNSVPMEQDGTVKKGSEPLGITSATKVMLDEKNYPQKRFFRSRAHCNPLSHNDGFKYPLRPNEYDWSIHYPEVAADKRTVRVLDIGMGFGGLTVDLAKLMPDKLILGMEIRAKVCEYVRLRVDALRAEHVGEYQNASCLRTNCMRYLPNFFEKESMDKIFFCFPDPHFKAKNHRRRIVNDNLLTEYSYIMAPDALLYTITDVKELHDWHVEKCTSHPGFERVSDEECERDPCVQSMLVKTEEGQKVARQGGHNTKGEKYFAVFRKNKDKPCLMASIF